jgi:hypothetical protein
MASDEAHDPRSLIDTIAELSEIEGEYQAIKQNAGPDGPSNFLTPILAAIAIAMQWISGPTANSLARPPWPLPTEAEHVGVKRVATILSYGLPQTTLRPWAFRDVAVQALEALEEEIGSAVRAAADRGFGPMSEYGGWLTRLARSVQDEKSLLHSLARSEASVEAITKTERDVAEAAGIVAAGALSIAFDELATEERTAADFFRRWTLIALAIVLAYGAYLAWSSHTETGAIVRRALVYIPALAVTAYLGAQSAGHRKEARWARIVVAQLRTINAYSDSLTDGRGVDLRYQLGQRVFGGSLGAQQADRDLGGPELDLLSRKVVDTIAEVARPK